MQFMYNVIKVKRFEMSKNEKLAMQYAFSTKMLQCFTSKTLQNDPSDSEIRKNPVFLNSSHDNFVKLLRNFWVYNDKNDQQGLKLKSR